MLFQYLIYHLINKCYLCLFQFAKQTYEESKKELDAAHIKQRVLVEDVKRSVAIAGNEKDKQSQFDEIAKERTVYSDKIRLLSDLNRKTIRRLNDEIKPRLTSITNKIKQMENTKNVKLEVRILKFVRFCKIKIFFV